MAERIPKAEEIIGLAALILGHGPVGPEPFTTRALWVVHVAAAKLALRCADADGDRAAVEQEGERLFQLLMKEADVEGITTEESTRARGKLQ